MKPSIRCGLIKIPLISFHLNWRLKGGPPRRCLMRRYDASIEKCRDHALEDHFLIFADRHLGDRCLKWDQIGKRHGVSGQKASNMARTVEDRFRRVLRDLIRPECRYASEIEEEIPRIYRGVQKRQRTRRTTAATPWRRR